MPTLSLRLLGPPRLEREHKLVKIGRRKAMAFVAYLAMSQQLHHRDELATLLWPASNQSRARGNLRRVLSDLKAVLGLSWLELEEETIGLKQGQTFWLDVAHFRDQMAACSRHGHSADEVCAACLPHLTEAVALYHHDFMAGFTLRNSPEFDTWQYFQVERLRQTLASALERLVVGHSLNAEFESAISYGQRRLALDPLHEPAHRQLMQLYAQTGQQSAALHQYQICQQTLVTELNVPPSEETIALYNAIRSGAESTITPSLSSSSSHPHPPMSNLPLQPTSFIGRGEERAEISRLLTKVPSCRLVTLTGPGGVGKTRLAIQAATEVSHAFSDGIYFIPLVSLRSVDALISAIAEAIQFPFYEQESPKSQLLNYLRQREMLLVLDNFEHLLSTSHQERTSASRKLVSDILSSAPQLKILVTSRENLDLTEEWVRAVGGLPVPESLSTISFDQIESAAEVETYDGIRLFLHRAQQIQAEFSLAADQVEVIRICRLVEGLPLAIELAVTWLKVLSCREIAQKIERGLDILTTSRQNIPARQRSIRAVFEHSWTLLSVQEREVFQNFSVFHGGCSRAAARFIAGASLPLLMSLVNKSLLQPISPGRFEMHELLRQFAAEKLKASGKTGAARRSHALFYARFLHQLEADLKGKKQVEALDQIDADFENVEAAWRWALDQKNYAVIGQSLRSLGYFCYFRSRSHAFKALFFQARNRLAPGDQEKPHPVWGRILLAEYFFAGPDEIDRVQIERGLAIVKQHGEQEVIATGLAILGEIALHADETAEALSYFETSLNHFRAANDRFNIARVLYLLAYTYRFLGQPDKAIDFARQSLEMSRGAGDKFWAAQSLVNTGVIALYTGNFSEAEVYLQEANNTYRDMGYKAGLAASGIDLAKLAFLRGEVARADTLNKEALEIAEDIGHAGLVKSARELAGTLAACLGEAIDIASDEQVLMPIIDMPATIDRYQVKKRLGAGDMGAVYLAYDPDHDHDVALKVANPDAIKKFDWFARMFKREAALMTELAHPGIVKCYGQGQTADYTYLVLEYIDGKNLEDLLDEQPRFLPVTMVVKWALQICDALIYLHGQKPEPLILRDLKPNNVMIDQENRARLIDFGIVEPYRPGRELPLIGTEGYSPPEQYIGYSDARSDIYALGITLHQLLTGRDPRREKPFSHHTVPPSSLNPKIPEALEAIILKAVEYKAKDRYQSATQMRDVLLDHA
ncbi:MAG: protein kinase [Anaerolineae bacterium]|nr:protein kinase [Anaerolineae bacterium]